jgi:predicted nucleotidyltransferase
MVSRLDPIVTILRAQAGELRRRGVVPVSIFGSVARSEDRQDSDVDILVELKPEVGILAFSELRRDLSDIMGRPVDLVTPGGLKPFARIGASHDAVRVF